MDSTQAQKLERTLAELRQLERELVQESYVRRSDGADRVREAIDRLAQVGSPARILDRAGEALGESSDFDLVLVSRLESNHVRPHALWPGSRGASATDLLPELERRAFALRYPLIEHDVARGREPALVTPPASGRRAAPELVEVLGWRAYVVAPIIVDGETVALIHAACLERSFEVDEIDRDLLRLYAAGLSQALERATLKELLARQRLVLESAAGWMNSQILALDPAAAALAARASTGHQLAELLTAREHEVMRLIAQGQSNRAIATTLVVSEGTVKYHVKNILRKLGARSRSDAISRYVRSGSEGSGQ